VARTFTAQLGGLQQTIQRIEAYSKEMGDGLDEELGQGVDRIAAKAKSRAPKGKSNALANSIVSDKSTRFSKAVEVRAFYAAYVEFGTGSNVFVSPFNFTPEMREFARDFFVNGKGRLYPQPFLFPSFIEEVPVILDKVKKRMFGRTI